MSRNLVDAICKKCGKAFRWLTGGPQICPACRLSEKELEVTIHALIEERDRVVSVGGNQYGVMTIEELGDFIARLQKKQRGA